MLTKERIKREVAAWKRNGESEGIVGKAHYLELCRLALLGLERDERQAVTSEQAAKDIKILEQIHAKSWDEAVALRHAAEALSERDERAALARSALVSAINGRRRFFGPVLCVPGRDGWAGEVWLHDPEKRERGSGLAFESLARLRELHPELWIVRTQGDGVLLDVCPITSEAP